MSTEFAVKIPSIRLTNCDRDNVARAAIRGAFEDRTLALAAEADVLGRTCYEAVFPEKTRKAAKALPDGWLKVDACLRFNVGGMDVRLDLVGGGVPVPRTHAGYCGRLGSISDPELVNSVTAHLSSVEKLKEDREKATSSLKGLLYSVSTLKALRDLWPEGETYFRGLTSKVGAPGLPAPQITELNAMLGLETRAAA